MTDPNNSQPNTGDGLAGLANYISDASNTAPSPSLGSDQVVANNGEVVNLGNNQANSVTKDI